MSNSAARMGQRELEEVSGWLESEDPGVALRWAVERFGEHVAMATGFGLEGVCLIDMFVRASPRPRIFYLDTGFLFPETRDLRDRLSVRYGIVFERLSSRLSPEAQASLHGPELWRRDPDKCCSLRKVEPLRQHLGSLQAWITAIRRDQTTERSNTRCVEWDAKFGLLKLNPLASWSRAQVWDYVRENDLTYNELHDRSYPSIGCTHCTLPVAAGEPERSGRWSGTAKTECGLHR